MGKIEPKLGKISEQRAKGVDMGQNRPMMEQKASQWVKNGQLCTKGGINMGQNEPVMDQNWLSEAQIGQIWLTLIKVDRYWTKRDQNR
jgi:hypothetical protein